jgi:hypothetical protein
VILWSRRVNPLAVAGIGGAIIAVLIGTALHPPAGRSGLPLALPEWVSVTDPLSVSCPEVAVWLPPRPAAVRAAVDAELAKLERQIVDMNRQLVRYPEQADERLAQIANKRLTVIERIIGDITKAGGVAPDSLKDLAPCSLQQHAVGSLEAAAIVGAEPDGEQPTAKPTKRPAKSAKAKGETKTGAATGGSTSHDPAKPKPTKKPAEKDDDTSAGAEDDGAAAQVVQCPSVKDHLPAVPSAAAAEVDQNLAELKQQIAEADAGIAELIKHPVDDPNFVQNTILGPLRDRRIATLDRITIAIGRVTTAPTGLAELAPCTFEG